MRDAAELLCVDVELGRINRVFALSVPRRVKAVDLPTDGQCGI